MRLTDIFEGTRPVATIWRKRGDRIERGRVTKFIPNLQPLTQIEVCDHGKETKEDEDAQSNCDSPQG